MEGSAKAEEKIQAMNKSKRADKFLYNFVLYSLTSLITCFFFSYPFWLLSMKHLISSIPYDQIPGVLMDAKCFFLLGNIIVLILLGELARSSSSQSSPALDMYNEYVARIRSYHVPAAKYSHVLATEKEEVKLIQTVKKAELKKRDTENIKIHRAHGEEEKMKKEKLEEKREEMRSVSKREIEIVKRKITKGEKVRGQNDDMPREELNKRVEAFIARVNKQRFLETKLVDQIRG